MDKQCPSENLQVGRLLASPSSSTWRRPSRWPASNFPPTALKLSAVDGGPTTRSTYLPENFRMTGLRQCRDASFRPENYV